MKKVLLTGCLAFAVLSCNTLQKPAPSEQNSIAKLSDAQLLDKVQQQSLKYFWEYAEPNSMLGRERYHEDNIYPHNDKHVVTTGGSGFGLATILVGVERGFVPRKEAVKRLNTMMDFLAKADRYKGVWSHWINGETGKTVPFGKKIMEEIW